MSSSQSRKKSMDEKRKSKSISNPSNQNDDIKIEVDNTNNSNIDNVKPEKLLSKKGSNEKTSSKSTFDLTKVQNFSVKHKGKHNRDNSFLKKLMTNIEFIKHEKEKKTESKGSLYNLFDSEMFDMHYAIFYLDSKEEHGIIDTLVNIVSKRFINQSFFYLPQLCTLTTYKKYSSSIENYILDRCVDQMKFTLKVNWLVSSYIDHSDSKGIKKIDKLIGRIEMTLVNARRATLNTNHSIFHYFQDANDDEIFKQSMNKEHRLKYFDKCMKFYNDMRSMCEKLKFLPKENLIDPTKTRNYEMRNIYLKNFNRQLMRLRKESKETMNVITNAFFKGYILPFDDYQSTEDKYNNLIVRFIPEESFCFSTKARVPTKITVETVRVFECEEWDLLYLKDESEDLLKKTNSPKQTLLEPKEPEVKKVKEYKSMDDFFKQLDEGNEEEEKDENTKKEEMLKFLKLSEQLEQKRLKSNQRHTVENKELLLHIKKIDSKFKDILINFEGDNNPFGEKFTDLTTRIKETSPFRNFITYSIKTFIAKANDDLRQELMTMQLIKRFDQIFKEADLPLKLTPYEILITSQNSGLIEFIPNSISIDGLKKKLGENWDLNKFFRGYFINSFEEAQKNFAESLAAYSLVCYILNIKDRHNGNMLIDMNGKIIHIDFGFILGISPGGVSFEGAPFKFTNEYLEIMDGNDSNVFHYFKSIFIRGFIEIRKHAEFLIRLIEVMTKGSKMPCFANTDPKEVIARLRERLHLNKSDNEYIKIVDDLIYYSVGNWRTVQYDNFQKYTNDIWQ